MKPDDTAFHAPRRLQARLDRGDHDLYYEVIGEGPPLVFAHGLGGNHLSWWQQVAHFAPSHTCITFAHQGFWPSSKLPEGPDPARYADDLQALITHLALDRVVLIGQSMGGWSGVEMSLRDPGRVRGLVLANTTGSIDARLVDAETRERIELWEPQARAQAESCLARGIHPAAGERMAREQPALHSLYRHIDETAAGLDKMAIRRRLQAGKSRDPRALAATGVPVLCLVGVEDIVLPPFAAEAMSRVVPRMRVVPIAAAGHSAYFERAEAFNRGLEDFLKALD